MDISENYTNFVFLDQLCQHSQKRVSGKSLLKSVYRDTIEIMGLKVELSHFIKDNLSCQ